MMTWTTCLAFVISAGCLRAAAYQCAGDLECTQGGVQGRCESVGFCSFPDTACASGQRFGEVSGTYSKLCVGDGGGGGDGDGGGVDGGVDGGTRDGSTDGPIGTIDAPAHDAADLGCPVGYAALAGIPDRQYRRLPTAAAWSNQVAACGGEGANIHLAIPDDTTELAALVTLAASTLWIGISDTASEGVFVTVLGGVPAILPWASGEPDNPGNQDCVQASASSQFAATACSSQLIAVCECTP